MRKYGKDDGERDRMVHLDRDLLIRILDNTFMNIFVTDAGGNVVFMNESSARMYDMPRSELLGINVQEMVEKGLLSRSQTLSVMATGKANIGYSITSTGKNLSGISVPIFDEEGKLADIITSSSEKGSLDHFVEEIEKERKRAENYKSAIGYFMGKDRNKALIFESEKMRALITKLAPVILTDSTVVIYGESGTGKDVIANYIHANSNRSTEPFIPVNCGAIPHELIEAEFFGYAQGAFTGASKGGKAGLLEISDKGTLFLDEIGDLPLSMQGKLLRVLEDKITRRIGSDRMTEVNVRILAATNKNLKEMVEERTFREDLFYRLNVMSVTLPPLRERMDDIIPLAEAFLDLYNEKYNLNKKLSIEIKNSLVHYPWQGNIRELKNVVERLSIVSNSELLTNVDLAYIGLDGFEKREERPVAPGGPIRPFAGEDGPRYRIHGRSCTVSEAFWQVEKQKILDALLKTNGNKSRAARQLGISRGKLYKLLGENMEME